MPARPDPVNSPRPAAGPNTNATGVVWVPTTEVRFSQATIGSTTRLNGKKLSLNVLVQTFREQGYVSEPINVVPMPDGKLTSLDNRRLWAAREAGLASIAAIVHQPDDPFDETSPQAEFLRPGEPVIDSDGVFGPAGEEITDGGSAPATMLEAMVFRCFRQRALGLDANYPLQGSFEPPLVTVGGRSGSPQAGSSAADTRRRLPSNRRRRGGGLDQGRSRSPRGIER